MCVLTLMRCLYEEYIEDQNLNRLTVVVLLVPSRETPELLAVSHPNLLLLSTLSSFRNLSVIQEEKKLSEIYN